jgi:SAM-dependent methyltransferase
VDEREKAWMRDRYGARLARFGDDIRTLGSGTEDRRRLRFKVLREVGIEPGASVVDVGCGFGDFYGYLRDEGVLVDYLGLDINPDLLAVAAEKYPGARFAGLDIETEAVEPADFVVASGTFNLALRHGDNYDYVGRVLERAFAVARRGVAVDFQSAYVDFHVADMHYYEPERVFAIARRLTKRVTLRHDYPLYEFCVYLFPDFAGWAPPGGHEADHG